MSKESEYFVRARSLRDEILGAPDVWLPRRTVLLEWLDGFLRRAEATDYVLAQSEAGDLDALDHFLRKQKVPVGTP